MRRNWVRPDPNQLTTKLFRTDVLQPQSSCVSIPLSTSMKKRTRMGAVIEEQKTLKHEIGVSNQFHLMDLPIPVLHEILFRLPINSIMKVKLVCRALYELLSDPDFAVNYTKISAFATLMGTTNFCKDTCAFDNLDLLEISDSYECIRTTFKPKIPGVSGFDLVGECNGLLCLSVRHNCGTDVVYICNPIMGECMALPECKIERGKVDVKYGFGFCRSTNNYKVLRIVRESGNALANGQGEICTIGIDDTWRGLANQTIHFTTFFNKFIIALNGFFHWIVVDNGCIRICTFDLGEEKIGQLSHPHGLVLNSFFMKLKSINNQLCLLDFSDPSMFVIWKMKEYGVAESWTKDILSDISLTSEIRPTRICPETILQNGAIVLSSPLGDYLILYNPIKRKLTEIRIPVHRYKTITYAPSLLSLKEAVKGGHQGTMNV